MGSLDRGGRNDDRQRRALQKLLAFPADSLNLTAGAGSGIVISGSSISIDLRDTTPGLELHSTGLGVIVGNGLELTATGVEVDLATDPGLEFSAGDLRVKIKANGGVTRDADGLSVADGDGIAVGASGVVVDLSASSGLEFSTGQLQIALGNGIEVDTGNLAVLLAANSGLGFSTGALTAVSNTEFITLGASGFEAPFWDDAYINSTIAGLVGPGNRHLILVGGEFADTDFTKNCRIFFPNIAAGSTVFSITAGAVASGTALSFIVTGSDNANGAGGGLTFKAGAGVAGNGGQFNFYAGDASGASGAGGNAFLGGGDSTASGNNNGGAAFLDGGRPSGTGNSQATMRVTNSAGTKTNMIDARNVNGSYRIAFYGKTPIAQPGTYTITAAPAVSTALDADANGGNYTGIDNAQAGNVYAQLTSLNDLRGDVASLAAVLRQLIKHLGDTSGLGLLDETSY